MREIISNGLAHRDYSSAYIAKMIIEEKRILVENGNRAHGMDTLNLQTFKPFPKSPAISKVFREIGYADELDSGMRNSYKYTRLYSGAEPEFIEGDVFEIIIPLSTGAMIKVGPRTSFDESNQTSEQAGEQAVSLKIDTQKLQELAEYCNEPKIRAQMQDFCGVNSRRYFTNNIMNPLLASGCILRTIPDKPRSPNQTYVNAASPASSRSLI